MPQCWRSAILVVAMLVVSTLVALPASASSPPPARPAADHAAILIDGDAEFTAANGVTGGSGTAADPYRIEGWTIDATQNIGLAIQNTRAHFVVRGITVNNGPTMGLGMRLSNVSHGRVERSFFRGNISAIQVWSGFGGVPDGVHDLAIVNNTFDLTWTDAITIAASDSVVAGNVIRMERQIDQGTFGIYALGRNLSLEDNRIVSAGSGMFVACSQGGAIRGNVVSSGLWGLDLWQSGGVVVYDNDFLEAGGAEGAFVNGVIDCGSFVPSGSNRWNETYPTGGNFWSGYHGVDHCSGALQDVCTGPDGIGDSPFYFPPMQTAVGDHYPLMAPTLGANFTYAYNLVGSATAGWGFTAATMTTPGPHLFGVLGAYLYLTLLAADNQSHAWFLDYNGNMVPDTNEPLSPAFSGAPPILFVFIPSAVGNFTYRDAIYPASMWGTFTVLPSLGPSANLTVEPSLGNLTTVFTMDASASLNESGGHGGLLFRWDWTSDGVWDTGWSTDPVATHVFSTGGWNAVAVQVQGTTGATGMTGRWAAVDDATPVTLLTVSGTLGGGGWYRGPVTLYFTAEDAFNDAFPPTCRIDGVAWPCFSGADVSWDGIHTIEYRTSDSTGHVEPWQSTVVKVDVTRPSLVVYSPEAPVRAGVVTLRWSGVDRASGIQGYQVMVDAGDPIEVGLATHADLSLSAGNHTIRVLATDVAGNTGLAIESVTVVAAPLILDPLLVLGVVAAGIAAVAGVAAVLLIRRRKPRLPQIAAPPAPRPPSPPGNP